MIIDNRRGSARLAHVDHVGSLYNNWPKLQQGGGGNFLSFTVMLLLQLVLMSAAAATTTTSSSSTLMQTTGKSQPQIAVNGAAVSHRVQLTMKSSV